MKSIVKFDEKAGKRHDSNNRLKQMGMRISEDMRISKFDERKRESDTTVTTN